MIQYHIYSYAQQKIKWLRDFIAENSGIIFHPWNPLLAGVNSLDNYLDVVLKSIKTKADSIAYQK